MYKLHIDKNELFEANIKLDGASMDETFARLVMNTDKWDLIFEGSIDKGGNIQIPIKKLKSILSDDIKGELKLEVVADDTYFTPWSDSFELIQSKNVTVEVKDNSNNKNTISESKPIVKIKEKKNEFQTPKPKREVQKTKKKKDNKTTEFLVKEYLREIMLAERKLNKGVKLKDKVKEITDNFIEEHNLQSYSGIKKELYGMVTEWKKVKSKN